MIGRVLADPKKMVFFLRSCVVILFRSTRWHHWFEAESCRQGALERDNERSLPNIRLFLFSLAALAATCVSNILAATDETVTHQSGNNGIQGVIPALKTEVVKIFLHRHEYKRHQAFSD